jgi:predicted nucleic acid-binding protein
MILDSDTTIFFDASCLIAAVGNPSGGSGFLLSICARGYLQAVVSQQVLLETQRNLQAKLGLDATYRFDALLAITPFSLAPLPLPEEIKELEYLVNKKDSHVVAAALSIQTSYLLTLDKGLIEEVNKADIGITAILPGEFIKNILPTHRDYLRGE